MIINFSDHIEKLQMVRSGKIKEGLKLDIPEIDEHFRFKTSNFNVILGHANTGKTIKHNLKWLVFSSENEPYTLMKKMIEFMEGNVINKIEEKHFKNRSEFINEHFKFIDPQELYSYKNILDLATELKKAWNYQGLLIDPFNSLIKDKDLSRTNTEALRKRHSDRHEYAGHPIPPMASDVEGGGKFVNRADDFIVIHRYIQHPTEWMNSLIHVRKVKDVDTGGRPTSIDSPIVLRSVKNNVGFEINGKNLLDLPKRVQTDLPF